MNDKGTSHISDEEFERFMAYVKASNDAAQVEVEDGPRKKCPRCREDLPANVKNATYCTQCRRDYQRDYYRDVRAGVRTPGRDEVTVRGFCQACHRTKQVKPYVHSGKGTLGPVCRDCRVVLDRIDCDEVWLQRMIDFVTVEDD